MGRGLLDGRGGPVDSAGGVLDGLHEPAGERDRGEVALHAVELALDRLELADPGGETVGLVTVGQSLRRRCVRRRRGPDRPPAPSAPAPPPSLAATCTSPAVARSSAASSDAPADRRSPRSRSSMSARERRRSVSAASDAACVGLSRVGDDVGLVELARVNVATAWAAAAGAGRAARRQRRFRPPAPACSPVSVACLRTASSTSATAAAQRGHVLVGGPQPLGRGRPLAGGPSGRGEVAPVLGVDLVDQQRLGAGQARQRRRRRPAGATSSARDSASHPDRSTADGRRRLQHPLRLPQVRCRRSRRAWPAPGRAPRRR